MSAEKGEAVLNDTAVHGLRWLAATRMASEVLALAAAVALARMVSPAEFGRAAVALLFVMLAGMLTFEGFASSLVQRSSIDENDRRAAMLLSIVGGAALSVLLYGLTDPIWQPLFGNRTAGLIALVSPVLLIGALGGVSRATLLRGLDFRRVSLIDVVALLVGSAVSVALAAMGLEAKAIVLGALAQAAWTTLMLVIVSPPPLPRWSLHAQRQIGAFGLPAALAALVDTLLKNIDYAILGATLPAAAAGYYYRAFNVGVVYQDKVSRVMAQIAYPLYSRTNSRDHLRRLHERAARVHAVIIFPLLASLVALAPLLVPFVFGPAWTPAVVPTQIMAVAGMIAAVLTGYPQVMLAIGRPRALLIMNIAMLVFYAAVITAASSHGLIVVSVGVVVAYTVNLLGIYHFLLKRHVDISVMRLFPELGPAVVGCLALLAVAFPLQHLLVPVLPRPLVIAAVGLTGLGVYGAVLYGAFRPAWEDLYGLVVRLVPPIGRIRLTRAAPASAPAGT